MANQPDINSILRLIGGNTNSDPGCGTTALLTSFGTESTQRPPVSSTTPLPQPGLSAPVPQAGAPYGAPAYPPPAAGQYQPPPTNYYPQPSASGSIDLSSIRPSTTGTLNSNSIGDAIARAKAFATQAGVSPYDRQAGAGYPGADPRGHDDRGYAGQRSRSKSPRGRDASYRDNLDAYRDERRGDHGGQSRGYGRDRSFSPRRQGFSPRGAHGGRDRSPLRGKEDNVETMEIEGSMVGLIIGRNGENLRRVESESRCRVQFIPPSGQNDRMRQCRITGPRAQREEAKDMINRIIRDSGMRAPPGQGGPRGDAREPRPDRNAPPLPKEGEDSLQIMVPDRTVGLIIGRGGETIRDLQERSGCHINIVSESKSVNGLRPVNLIGAPAAAKLAKEFILDIVDSDSRNGGNNPMGGAPPRGPPRNEGYGGGGGGGGPGGGPGGHDKINDSIYVPSDAVGMIIGKGGETIREMQNATGCKINVSQPSGPNEDDREIGLVGSRESIERAKRAIEDKVDAAVSFP